MFKHFDLLMLIGFGIWKSLFSIQRVPNLLLCIIAEFICNCIIKVFWLRPDLQSTINIELLEAVTTTNTNYALNASGILK